MECILAGRRGPQGEMGPVGETGPKGDKGATGSAGKLSVTTSVPASGEYIEIDWMISSVAGASGIFQASMVTYHGSSESSKRFYIKV